MQTFIIIIIIFLILEDVEKNTLRLNLIHMTKVQNKFLFRYSPLNLPTPSFPCPSPAQPLCYTSMNVTLSES